MDLINFTIPNRNGTLCLKLDKPFTFVFGGNGAGKSTCAKKIKELDKNCILFDSSFVSKNVFVNLGDNGSLTQSSSNKDSFSELFLEEAAVDENKILTNLQSLKKACSSKENDESNAFSKELGSYKLQNVDLMLYCKKCSSKISFDENKSYEDNFASLSVNTDGLIGYKNDDEFNVAVGQYQINSLLNVVTNKIKQNVAVDYWLENGSFEKDFCDKLKRYNANIDSIINIQKAFSASSDAGFQEWIKKGVELHDKLDSCLFFHSKNISGNVANWKKVIENDLLITKNSLVVYLTKISDFIVGLDQDYDEKWHDSLPKVHSSLVLLLGVVKSSLTALTQNKQFDCTIKDKPERDEVFTDSANLLEKLACHIFLKKAKEYFAPQFFGSQLSDLIKQHQSKLDGVIESCILTSTNAINKCLDELQSGVHISISKDNNSGKRRMSLSRQNGSLGTFSEGEIHQVGLAVFFARLNLEKPENKTIVFDDPMISLDVAKYHLFKRCLFNMRLTDPSLPNPNKIVLFTHNFHFLLCMLSVFSDGGNLSGENIANLWSLGKRGLRQIQNINSINCDDFSLLRLCIPDCKTSYDITLINWFLCRFYRVALDLRLRMIGEISQSDPEDDLEKLLKDNCINATDVVTAEAISQSLGSKIHQKEPIDINVLKETAKQTDDFFMLLGMPSPRLGIMIDGMKPITVDPSINSEKENPKELESFYLGILNVAKELYDKNDKSFQGYFRHSRYQITESVIQICGSADIS